MAVTTEIPWGDGTSDKIYLTRNASEGNQTVLVSSDANTGAARSKVVTFSASGVTPVTLTVSQEAGGIVIYNTLTFDGQSAIDTGINASMPTEIQVTLASCRPSSWKKLNNSAYTSTLIGGRASSSSKRRDIQLQAINQTTRINQIIFGVGNTSKNFTSLSLNPSDELYLAQGPTYYKYNNTRTARGSQDTFTSTAHYVIGAQNNNGTIDYTYASHDTYKNVKIYSTEGGTLVRDLVPAVYNGQAGMYDQVSQTFFGNIGTGTLVAQ